MGKMLWSIFFLSNRTEGPEMACGRNEKLTLAQQQKVD